MKPRAFTMLETLMAASLGAIVVLACLGIFASMDRTDRATALRFDQTSALSRVHLVMTRVFGNLVMSDVQIDAGGGREATPEEGVDIRGVRPRIMLEGDGSPSLKGSLRAAGIGGGGRPQRLEVVVSRAPVPAMMTSARGEAMAMALYEPSIYAGPATRGVFELRPELPRERARALGVPGIDPRRPGYTLWWRPLPHESGGAEGELFSMEPEKDPMAVPIASGLEKCRWIAFSKRERKDAFRALQFQDLPAYMEMEVRTTTGLTANWMFEVDWINGPETQEELEERQQTTQVAGGAAAVAQPDATAASARGARDASGKPGIAPGSIPRTTTDEQGNVRTITEPDTEKIKAAERRRRQLEGRR
jgi:hypothetical protein